MNTTAKWNNKDIIVTMTSYPKRIDYVGDAISELINNQTVKATRYILWLADPEFPGRILPVKLEHQLTSLGVEVHWVESNTICHKRHESCRQWPDAYNFVFDDDIIYDPTTMEEMLVTSDRYPGTIVSLVDHVPHFEGLGFSYTRSQTQEPLVCRSVSSGYSLFPPNCFPYEAFSRGLERDILTKELDESWLEVWTMHTGIPKTCARMPAQDKAEVFRRSSQNTAISPAQWATIPGERTSVRAVIYASICLYMPEIAKEWISYFPRFDYLCSDMVRLATARVSGRIQMPLQTLSFLNTQHTKSYQTILKNWEPTRS
jgi:hypothetical protein